MTRLARRAELVKLGDALKVDPVELSFLQVCAADKIKELRAAVYDHLFGQQRRLMERFGRVIRWLPNWLLALLVPFIGPFLRGRMAMEIPARRARMFVRRTTAAVAAAASREVDPRRLRELLVTAESQYTADAMLELHRVGDHVTAGRFVDFLREDTLHAVLAKVELESFVPKVAFYMESRTRVDNLVRLVPEPSLRAMLARLEDPSCDGGLEIVALLVQVSERMRRRFGVMMAELPEKVLVGAMAIADREGIWADVLFILHTLPRPIQERVLGHLARKGDQFVDSIGDAMDGPQLWTAVLPLVEVMPDPLRVATARAMAGRGRATMLQAVRAAARAEAWDELIAVAMHLPPELQDDFAGVIRHDIGGVDPALEERVMAVAKAHGLAWSESPLVST